MTEEESQDVKMATIYELRLIFKSSEKKEYTIEEILDMFDNIAMAKDQEK